MSTCRGGKSRRSSHSGKKFYLGGGHLPTLRGPFFRLEGTFSPFVVILSMWGGGGGFFSTYVEKFLGLFLYLQKFLRAPMLSLLARVVANNNVALGKFERNCET